MAFAENPKIWTKAETAQVRHLAAVAEKGGAEAVKREHPVPRGREKGRAWAGGPTQRQLSYMGGLFLFFFFFFLG